MDSPSKRIGVRIMEKFKIYVHHKYSYERFWYFFHGVDVNIDDVITHSDVATAFNKKLSIEKDIRIDCSYKEIPLEINFVGDTQWNLEGHHIFDYSISLYDNGNASDRGFNSNIMEVIDNDIIPKFNILSKNKKNKYHLIYIKWEGHHSYGHHQMQNTLNYNVNVYGDDFPTYIKPRNYFFLFTNTFMSFIYPNTLGLREFHFMAKFLKNRKFKHKINFPIRRLYGSKIKLYNKIKKCKNVNVTHSSFHDTKQYSNDQVQGWRDVLINDIGQDNVIEKRGYGIHDWGGEWNDDNIKEMQFKLYDISDVNIIPEYSPAEALKKSVKESDKRKVGSSYITEKSVSHILIGKPFLPISFETIDFYQKMMEYNNKKYKNFPISYNHLSDVIEYIDEIASDDTEWKLFVEKLQDWVDVIKNNIIEIINSKNDLLEVVLNKKNSEKDLTNNII